MKKFFVLAVLFTAISLTASAQFKAGVKAGMNLSKLSLDKRVVASDNQMGFFIGPTVKFQIPLIGLGFDAAALYDQRSGNLELGSGDQKLKQKSFQIPINVRYGFGLGKVVNLFLFVGPQFGFNVGDRVTSFYDGGVTYEFKKSTISGNAGLGVLLFSHLQVSVNYNMTFDKSGEFTVNNYYGEKFGYNGVKNDAKMKTWQIAVAYYF